MIFNKYNQHLQNNTLSTLFVGQNLIKLLKVDSTNNYLKSLLSNSEPLPEGTVIMADEQFAGRGQQENTWQATPGKNLTFSVLLKPNFLPLNQQFMLNMAVSVALQQALQTLVGDVSIKWPNDIYYQNKKIGGVLIENTIVGTSFKNAVVGVGINVNEQLFSQELKDKAISLQQILRQDVDLTKLLLQICVSLEQAYLQLKAKNFTFLRKAYNANLYQLNIKAPYRQNGEVFEGTIIGVTELGKLIMQKDLKQLEFNFKEIEFLTHTI